MIDARIPPVSDRDLFRLLDALIRSERSTSAPTVFDTHNPIHCCAVDRGLAVVRPWPLASKGEPDHRQCLLVNVTAGWKWMRLQKASRRYALTQERRPAIWSMHRPRPAYVSNTY